MRLLSAFLATLLLAFTAACSTPYMPPPRNDWLANAPEYSQDSSSGNSDASSDLEDVGAAQHNHSHGDHR